jgi:hypothetical protein
MAGIAATQLEQPSQEGWLGYLRRQPDIAGDGGLTLVGMRKAPGTKNGR